MLKALGAGDDLAHSSIRFGLGRFNTEEEVDYVAQKVIDVVRKLRELSPLYEMHKEGIDLTKVGRCTNLTSGNAEVSEDALMRVECTLQCQHPDRDTHLGAPVVTSPKRTSPAALRETLVDVVHTDAGHRGAEALADTSQQACIAEVSRRLHNGLRPRSGIVVPPSGDGSVVSGSTIPYRRVWSPGTCITATTRNHQGRMGSKEASIYLGGPATVAWSAVMGAIADPRPRRELRRRRYLARLVQMRLDGVA